MDETDESCLSQQLFPLIKNADKCPWLQRPDKLPQVDLTTQEPFCEKDSKSSNYLSDNPSENITLSCSDRLGTKTTVKCSRLITIYQLKEVIGKSIGQLPKKIILAKGPTILKDWVTIIDCNLGDGSSLELRYS